MQTLEHAIGVGEGAGVPDEVGPVELAHPEAVEVEGGEGQVAFGESVDEGVDRLLVVGGGEARGEPESVAPRGHERGSSRECGVPLEHVLAGGTSDNEVLQSFALHRELHAFDGLRAELVRHGSRVVDEHSVAAVGEVEGDVLVRLLAAGAAVGVPDVDGLAVLHERAEALAQAVDVLTDAEVELLVHEGPSGRVVHVPDGPVARSGEPCAAGVELERPGCAFADGGREWPAGQGADAVDDGRVAHALPLVTGQGEAASASGAAVVLDADADDALCW